MEYLYLKNGQSESGIVDNAPFDIETDVCVVGMGSAGCLASIKASKMGVRVVGIEKCPSVGGLSTLGNVVDYYYGSSGGIFEDVNARCNAVQARGYEETAHGNNHNSYMPVVRIRAYDEIFKELGTEVLCDTILTGVYLDGDRVTGIKCFNGRREFKISAKYFIDCTGDALLSRMSGCEMNYGNKLKCQNTISSYTGLFNHPGSTNSGWMTCGIEDMTNSEVFSHAMNVGCHSLVDVLLTCNEQIISFAENVGMRDGHCTVTETQLSFEEYLNGYRAKEPVFYAFSMVDDPNRDIAVLSDANQDWRLIANMANYGISVGVPKEALIPKGKKGLLVAGKGFGVDKDMLCCIRMRKDMEKCGEVAGLMASMAILDGCDVRELDYQKLIEELSITGCYDEANNVILTDITDSNGRDNGIKTTLPKTVEEIKECLGSTLPKKAYVSIRMGISEADEEQLVEWMNCDGLLGDHSAIALGMMNNPICIQRLIKNAEAGPKVYDGFTFSLPYYTDYSVALILFGRLGYNGRLDILFNAIKNKNELAKGLPTGGGFFTEEYSWRFQFETFALVSLIKIGRKHKGISEIDDFIFDWFINHEVIGREMEDYKSSFQCLALDYLIEIGRKPSVDELCPDKYTVSTKQKFFNNNK